MVDLLLIFQFKYNDNIYRFQFTSPFFQLVPGYVTACESFDMRSAASKQDYLLTLEVPEEMMAECGTVDELSDELVAKIGENCLDECQDLQRQAANDLLEFVYPRHNLIFGFGEKIWWTNQTTDHIFPGYHITCWDSTAIKGIKWSRSIDRFIKA